MAGTIIINLSDLGPRGFAILGAASEDGAGSTVSNAGDVNGDGYADIIVGASRADGADGPSHGRAYVLFGKAGGFGTIDLANLTPAGGFVITGAGQRDYAATALSGSGDFNGDGFADIMIGAPDSNAGAQKAGAAYVILGKADGFGPIDLGNLAPTDGFAILGASRSEHAGQSVALVGDVNNDGFADAVVGVPRGSRADAGAVGDAFVIFGKADGFGTIDLAHFKPGDGFAIEGDQSNDGVGSGVTTAGDVNGDGYADLVVGGLGGTGAGRVYVVFGSAHPATSIDLRTLTPDAGFVIKGDPTYDYIGNVVSAGDVNADGFADVIIGSFLADGSGRGAAYVLYGRADGFHDIDLTDFPRAEGAKIVGEAPGDFLGGSVSAAGDVNGDGFADVIVGAARNGDGGHFAGRAYVLYGGADGMSTVDLTNLQPSDGFVIQGGAADDAAGLSVSAAGDINDDGFDDVIVGAPGNDLGGFDTGGAYVIFGMAPTDDVRREGTDIGNTIHGGSGNDLLEGYGGDDTLIGGDGNDKLYGQAGDDDLQGGDGDDKLNGVTGDDVIQGGTGKDRLGGGAGNDILYGGADQDVLSGGRGADQFHFSLGGTAPDAANADIIKDFSQSQHDLLDLTDYDANPATKGDDPFAFIGAAAFSGTAGELRYEVTGTDTLVSGDTNGDRVADFTIRLTGAIALTAADFLFAMPTTPAHAFLANPDLSANPMLHLA